MLFRSGPGYENGGEERVAFTATTVQRRWGESAEIWGCVKDIQTGVLVGVMELSVANQGG